MTETPRERAQRIAKEESERAEKAKEEAQSGLENLLRGIAEDEKRRGEEYTKRIERQEKSRKEGDKPKRGRGRRNR